MKFWVGTTVCLFLHRGGDTEADPEGLFEGEECGPLVRDLGRGLCFGEF